MSSIKLFHGTRSGNLKGILKNGFLKNSYFTTSIDDGIEYAAMGGEWDLQVREEAYWDTFGVSAREEYLDTWAMYKDLFPKGEVPIVLEIEVNLDDLEFTHDSGAEGAICISKSMLVSEVKVLECKWESDTLTHFRNSVLLE